MTRHAASTRTTHPASPITGEYRKNLAELISRLAAAGRNDPDIATHLGITVSRVRGLRADFDIPAGERRWLPAHTREGDDDHAAADAGSGERPPT